MAAKKRNKPRRLHPQAARVRPRRRRARRAPLGAGFARTGGIGDSLVHGADGSGHSKMRETMPVRKRLEGILAVLQSAGGTLGDVAAVLGVPERIASETLKSTGDVNTLLDRLEEMAMVCVQRAEGIAAAV